MSTCTRCYGAKIVFFFIPATCRALFQGLVPTPCGYLVVACAEMDGMRQLRKQA